MPYKNKEERNERARHNYHSNEEIRKKMKVNCKRFYLRKLYGLTLEDYELMFNNQNGACAICKRHQSHFVKALAVDHDHETGKVRALLCEFCNTAIGLLQDNPDIILEASNYVRGHK